MTTLTITIPTNAVPTTPPSFNRRVSAGPEWFKNPHKSIHADLDGAICPLEPAPPYSASAKTGAVAHVVVVADAPRSPLSPPGTPATPTSRSSFDSLDTPPLTPDSLVSPGLDAALLPTTYAPPSPLPGSPRAPGASRKRAGSISHKRHRRTQSLADPELASALFGAPPSAPRSKHRARFSSMPVTGVITPLWTLDEDESGSDPESELLTPGGESPAVASARAIDPFEMLLPFAQTKSEKQPNELNLNEDDFVIAHVPLQARTIRLAHFRPRLPYVPRHRRPIVTVIVCLLLFGTLLTCSLVQQTGVAQQRAAAMRQKVWLEAAHARAEVASDMFTDIEPGVTDAKPRHHDLDVQQRVGQAAHAAAAGTDTAVGGKPAAAEPFVMNADDELAALMSFIVGTTANAIPPADPTRPLDPDVFLPFAVAAPDARAEMDELAAEVWDQYPVLILGGMRDPKMRAARRLFGAYKVRPAPTFVEIDQRRDGRHLAALLARLLGGKGDGPYVLLQGKHVGSTTKLTELEKEDKLIATLAQTGTSIAKKVKKDKHAREIERLENERVLGPQAVEDA